MIDLENGRVDIHKVLSQLARGSESREQREQGVSPFHKPII